MRARAYRLRPETESETLTQNTRFSEYIVNGEQYKTPKKQSHIKCIVLCTFLHSTPFPSSLTPHCRILKFILAKYYSEPIESIEAIANSRLKRTPLSQATNFMLQMSCLTELPVCTNKAFVFCFQINLFLC